VTQESLPILPLSPHPRFSGGFERLSWDPSWGHHRLPKGRTVEAVGGLSAAAYRLSSQYRDQPGGRMMYLVRCGAGALPSVQLDSRQPSQTEVPMRLIGLAVVIAGLN